MPNKSHGTCSLRKELFPCLPPAPTCLAALLESQEDGLQAPSSGRPPAYYSLWLTYTGLPNFHISSALGAYSLLGCPSPTTTCPLLPAWNTAPGTSALPPCDRTVVVSAVVSKGGLLSASLAPGILMGGICSWVASRSRASVTSPSFMSQAGDKNRCASNNSKEGNSGRCCPNFTGNDPSAALCLTDPQS